MKKIIPALALLLVSAVMLATSSFAWFSMNTTVSVTGMEVRTQVGSNLWIASDTTANLAKKEDDQFVGNYDGAITGLLEPVSTINGINYFYTLNDNVKADGDALTDEYVAYNAADTSAFVANSVAGAVGYVDYAFQLKASNANDSEAQYINLKTLNLAYKGTDDLTGINAFRVAIFVEKYNEDAAGTAHSSNTFHAIGTTWDDDGNGETAAVPYGSTTLMKNAAAANRTATKAVAYVNDAAAVTALENPSAKALQDVTYGAFNYITVDAGETAYYKVVVRLWLEGEDAKCSNDVFVNLTDKFELDMEWSLVENASKANKANITNGTYTLVTGNYTVTTTGAKNISSTDYNVVTGLTYNGKQVYTTAAAGTLTAEAHLFTIGGEPEAATEVTSSFNLK
jgi:hypothetical protein